jgi:hypothetical protein
MQIGIEAFEIFCLFSQLRSNKYGRENNLNLDW